MLNFVRTIEIIISFQLILISTMVPFLISLPTAINYEKILGFPITLQVPVMILISLLFEKQSVYKAFTIYLILGLFVFPIFTQGGSLGYLLTPNFGYLIGFYPLINIINNLNNKNKIYIFQFIKKGLLAISTMHIIGILYNFFQMLYYRQIDLFLNNLGSYSLSKIGYHILMLIPLSLLIKPINHFKNNK